MPDAALVCNAASKDPPFASAFVLKIAERCNLNCSYCYMYNKGDVSFKERPKFHVGRDRRGDVTPHSRLRAAG